MSMSDTENTPKPEDEAPENVEEVTGSTDEAVESADETVQRLGGELDDLRDRLLRTVAETENTRKRAEKEVRDTREYAVSNFAKDMLDVADNLSRALAVVDDEALADASEPLKNLVDGVAMTERALLSKMERHGVKKIDPAPGEAFDPHVHQAVAQIPSDQPAGRIASVMQTGFVIGTRTLRAAMVAVSAGQASGGDDGAPGGNVDVKA